MSELPKKWIQKQISLVRSEIEKKRNELQFLESLLLELQIEEAVNEEPESNFEAFDDKGTVVYRKSIEKEK